MVDACTVILREKSNSKLAISLDRTVDRRFYVREKDIYIFRSIFVQNSHLSIVYSYSIRGISSQFHFEFEKFDLFSFEKETNIFHQESSPCVSLCIYTYISSCDRNRPEPRYVEVRLYECTTSVRQVEKERWNKFLNIVETVRFGIWIISHDPSCSTITNNPAVSCKPCIREITGS